MMNPHAIITLSMEPKSLPQPQIGEMFAIYLVFAWMLIWKGIGMWQAAKQHQRNWFIAFLVISPPLFPSFGILELLYLFKFAKKKMTIHELKTGFKKIFTRKEASK